MWLQLKTWRILPVAILITLNCDIFTIGLCEREITMHLIFCSFRFTGRHSMAFSENGTVLEKELDPYGLLSHFDMNIVIGIQSALLLLGVTGNTLILYLFGKRRERPTYVIAVLALAVKDLVACCIYLPFSIALEARGFVTSSNFVCKSYHFLSNLTFNFTMPSLLLIALDRCVCVWRGHAQASNTRRVFIAIGVLGVFSLSVSIVQSLAFRVNEGYCGFSVSRTSLEHLRLFEKIMVFAFQTDAIVSILVYFAIFGTVFFIRSTLQTSTLHIRSYTRWVAGVDVIQSPAHCMLLSQRPLATWKIPQPGERNSCNYRRIKSHRLV